MTSTMTNEEIIERAHDGVEADMKAMLSEGREPSMTNCLDEDGWSHSLRDEGATDEQIEIFRRTYEDRWEDECFRRDQAIKATASAMAKLGYDVDLSDDDDRQRVARIMALASDSDQRGLALEVGGENWGQSLENADALMDALA